MFARLLTRMEKLLKEMVLHGSDFLLLGKGGIRSSRLCDAARLSTGSRDVRYAGPFTMGKPQLHWLILGYTYSRV